MTLKLSIFAVVMLGATFVYYRVHAQQQDVPKHKEVATDGKNLVVQLCDGETSKVVEGVPADGKLTAEQAQKVSNDLMAMWFAKVDPKVAAAWKKDNELAASLAAQEQKKAPAKPAATGKEEEQPNDFTTRDQMVWKRELEKEIKYGDEIFHSDQLIGSTNGFACAMCHPNAANTHPETYPKFQIQLRRVALLRDMINWCIEQPVRGKKLDPDDPKMRAIEAYILSQRKGVPMEAGKH
jgi:thiosulfate dehydrogenase